MPKNKRTRAALVVLVTFTVFTVGLILYYLKIKDLIRLDCVVYKYTGLSCPACGATRMVTAILNGEVYQAFRYNPFMFVTAPYIVITYLVCTRSYINTGRVSNRAANLILVYAILIILFGVIRNIGPFRILLPSKLV